MYKNSNEDFTFSEGIFSSLFNNVTISSARCIPPLPPFSYIVIGIDFTFFCFVYSSINSISSSLSSLNLFIATITGKLYKDIFDICLSKFSRPSFKSPLP